MVRRNQYAAGAGFSATLAHAGGSQKGQAGDPASLFQQHNCRQQSKIEEGIQAIASAVAATLDAAVILSGHLAVAALV
jgi:hypothetical protein